MKYYYINPLYNKRFVLTGHRGVVQVSCCSKRFKPLTCSGYRPDSTNADPL